MLKMPNYETSKITLKKTSQNVECNNIKNNVEKKLFLIFCTFLYSKKSWIAKHQKKKRQKQH